MHQKCIATATGYLPLENIRSMLALEIEEIEGKNNILTINERNKCNLVQKLALNS